MKTVILILAFIVISTIAKANTNNTYHFFKVGTHVIMIDNAIYHIDRKVENDCYQVSLHGKHLLIVYTPSKDIIAIGDLKGKNIHILTFIKG